MTFPGDLDIDATSHHGVRVFLCEVHQEFAPDRILLGVKAIPVRPFKISR